MPIYEYKCEQCGHQLEALQAFSDQPLSHCPKCYKGSLNKLISSANFHLKGTGWYKTDFRDKDRATSSSQAPSAEQQSSGAATHESVESNNNVNTKVNQSTDNSTGIVA